MLGADCFSIHHLLSFSTLEEDNKEALLSSYSSSCKTQCELSRVGIVAAVKYRNRFSLSRSGTDLDTHKSTPNELKVLLLSFLRKWKGCVVLIEILGCWEQIVCQSITLCLSQHRRRTRWKL